MSATNGALQPRPLQFSINGDTDIASRYGNLFWSVGLPDGREAFVMADRFEVTAAGALLAWQDSRPTGDDYERESLATPQLTLALAPGAWLHCYAASLLGGDPVVITGLAAPGGGA